jgi:hypothetical protein
MAKATDREPATGDGDGLVDVEVVYAEPQRQVAIQLRVPPGSTLQHAIDASGIVRSFPEIDLAQCKLGIYGKLARADTVLTAQDRVEIYRPLPADPKDIRKQRAAAGVPSRSRARR